MFVIGKHIFNGCKVLNNYIFYEIGCFILPYCGIIVDILITCKSLMAHGTASLHEEKYVPILSQNAMNVCINLSVCLLVCLSAVCPVLVILYANETKASH